MPKIPEKRALRVLTIALAVFFAGLSLPANAESEESANAPSSRSYNAVSVSTARKARVGGKTVTVNESGLNDAGFAVPDAGGGYVWFPTEAKAPPPGFADARELKLHVRELAAQLIAGMDPAYGGMVAIPTSFVNQEDFSQTSPLGRFIAEQLLYEFNQRGFPIREYRLAKAVTVREDGEFLLSRKVPGISAGTPGALFVVGTYFIDRQAVFVNARLVRGNGAVVRTAQLVLPNTSLTRRMLAGGGKTLKAGTISVRDYKSTTKPTNLTPIDMGADVH